MYCTFSSRLLFLVDLIDTVSVCSIVNGSVYDINIPIWFDTLWRASTSRQCPLYHLRFKWVFQWAPRRCLYWLKIPLVLFATAERYCFSNCFCLRCCFRSSSHLGILSVRRASAECKICCYEVFMTKNVPDALLLAYCSQQRNVNDDEQLASILLDPSFPLILMS